MKGYKVFDPDWTCRGFQFEEGKVFEENLVPKCCERGFHFCTKISDCFSYYCFDPNNKVAEVEALGDIDIQNDDSKCCTNKIHIVRELTWQEVLKLANLGESYDGFSNSGDYNSGDFNSGHYNSGNYDGGVCNSGNNNSGNSNSGNSNSGDRNSGNNNSGNWNSGNHNSGNWNSGDWNKTCFSNGCFNTEIPKIFLFNKLSDWTYWDWLHSDARFLLMNCPSNVLSWILEDNMTNKEKEKHPEYLVTGGFLKHIERKKQKWWNRLSNKEKQIIMQLPNFDKDIFKEITGIDVDA